jgi:hypothetical protein
MHRTVVATLLLACSLGTHAQQPSSAAVEQQLAAYRATAMQFGQQLRAELQSAMQSGGPMAAVGVCQVRAPQIAGELSAASGWDIQRTSLKARARPADAWETAVLEGFEVRKAEGVPLAQIEHYAVLEMEGKPTLRYMKAIPTEAACLACHGSQVEPQLQAHIRQLYPSDQALGYAEGDIRGAFSISAPAP